MDVGVRADNPTYLLTYRKSFQASRSILHQWDGQFITLTNLDVDHFSGYYILQSYRTLLALECWMIDNSPLTSFTLPVPTVASMYTPAICKAGQIWEESVP